MNTQITFKSFIAFIIIISSTYSFAQISSSGSAPFSQVNQLEQPTLYSGGDIIRTIPLSPNNQTLGIEWVRDTIYVLSQAVNDTSAAVLQKVNPVDGTLLSQFSLPFTGYVLGITFDGKNLWIVKWHPTQEIYHISTNGNIISSFAAPDSSVRGIAWDGQHLWIGEAAKKIFYQVDTLGNVIKSLFWSTPYAWPMGIEWVAAHSTGHLWVNDDYSKRIFQLKTGDSLTVVQNFPFPNNNYAYLEGICYDGEYLWVSDFHVDTLWQIDDGIITGIEHNNFDIPAEFLLAQNYPNPFNPTTKISYSIPKSGYVSLKVYDILGKEVVTLVNEQKHAGKYEVKFDASNLASGIYFYRLTSGKYIQSKKMILLK